MLFCGLEDERLSQPAAPLPPMNETFTNQKKEFEEINSHITCDTRLLICNKTGSGKLSFTNALLRDVEAIDSNGNEEDGQETSSMSSEYVERMREHIEAQPEEKMIVIFGEPGIGKSLSAQKLLSRFQYVERMREHIEAQPVKKSTIIITGEPGIGKSLLAQKLLSRFQDELIEKIEALDGSSWFDTGQQERVDIIYHVCVLEDEKLSQPTASLPPMDPDFIGPKRKLEEVGTHTTSGSMIPLVICRKTGSGKSLLKTVLLRDLQVIDNNSGKEDDRKTNSVRSEDEIEQQEVPNASLFDTGHQEGVEIDCQEKEMSYPTTSLPPMDPTFIVWKKVCEEISGKVWSGKSPLAKELLRDIEIINEYGSEEDDQETNSVSSEDSLLPSTSASTSKEDQESDASSASNRTLTVTVLSSEWRSTKGGLSTINRELAYHLAKHSNVEVSLYLPQCTEEDKRAAAIHRLLLNEAAEMPGHDPVDWLAAASHKLPLTEAEEMPGHDPVDWFAAASHKLPLIEAKEMPGYDPVDWFANIPVDFVLDCVIGHGVRLSRQVSLIKRVHHDCKWIQSVYPDPEEPGMFKGNTNAISKCQKKHRAGDQLCQLADVVIPVDTKVSCEAFSHYWSRGEGKDAFNLTPSIFTAELKHVAQAFRVSVFGRSDIEDLKRGHDIFAKAIAELEDMPQHDHFVFVDVPSSRKVKKIKEVLLKGDIFRSQLVVRSLRKVPFGSYCVVNSEDPKEFVKAIRAVREKNRAVPPKESKEHRWQEQCDRLAESRLNIMFGDERLSQSAPSLPLLPSFVTDCGRKNEELFRNQTVKNKKCPKLWVVRAIADSSREEDSQETSSVRSEDETEKQEALNSSLFDTGYHEQVDIDCQEDEKLFQPTGSLHSLRCKDLETETFHLALETLHSELKTLHSELKTLHSELETLHSLRETFQSELATLHSLRETRHSERETFYSLWETRHLAMEALYSLEEVHDSELETLHSLRETRHSERKTLHSLREFLDSYFRGEQLFQREEGRKLFRIDLVRIELASLRISFCLGFSVLELQVREKEFSVVLESFSFGFLRKRIILSEREEELINVLTKLCKSLVHVLERLESATVVKREEVDHEAVVKSFNLFLLWKWKNGSKMTEIELLSATW